MKLEKTYVKYMLVYLGCVPMVGGFLVSRNYTTEIHGRVASSCTTQEPSDLKYTTKYTVVYLVV